jgi:hypothetical protein
MLLVTKCIRCQELLRLEEAALGKRVRCPSCHTIFTAQAGTPVEDFRHQHGLAHADGSTEQTAEPPLWSSGGSVAMEDEPAPRRQPERPDRQRRSTSHRREEPRQTSRDAPPDPRRRPIPLVLSAFLLPFGIPLLLLLFVPGGIIAPGLALGLGLPLALVTMLMAALFALSSWPLRTRVLLTLGFVAAAYGVSLVVIIVQWEDFSSSDPTRGSLVAGFHNAQRKVPGHQGIRPPPPGPPEEAPQFNIDPDRPSVVKIPQVVGYWPLDEIDRFGPPTTKNLVATPSSTSARVSNVMLVDGKFGKAFELDAAHNSSVDLGQDWNLNFAALDDFTIAGWVRTRDRSGTVLSMRNSAREQPMIDISLEGGLVKANVRGDRARAVGPPPFILGDEQINDGEWHHFAVTRDNGSKIVLFLDGKPSDGLFDDRAGGPITTDWRYLGRERYQEVKQRQVSYFTGSIDEFCIFKRALSHEEIRKLAK